LTIFITGRIRNQEHWPSYVKKDATIILLLINLPNADLFSTC